MGKAMDYQSALDYVLRFADYERIPRSAVVFDLRRIEQLLARLGDPHRASRAVHVAGTKGKGSTASMIAAILTGCGYRVGLYTSPHLLSFTERIQIDGQPIPEAAFARTVEILMPEVEAVNREARYGELTTFEILTALAFHFFREEKVDFQVMETGLGGRLDATNVVQPEVAVLTSISFDHMDVLGDTLAKIATEKAGIIKSGITVVSAPQFPEAREVISRTCREKKARLVQVGDDVTWQGRSFTPEGQSFTVRGLRGEYELYLPLLGEYQMENAATAVAAAEILAEKSTAVTAECIKAGLAGVRWPGRLQILRQRPWLVIDGAHNAYSMQRLVAALRKYFTFQKAFFIFGSSSDKDVSGMVRELAELKSEVIVTRSRHPRAVAPAVLAEEFRKRGITAEVADDVGAAVARALQRAEPADLICAAGSIFLIAEVMEYLDTQTKPTRP